MSGYNSNLESRNTGEKLVIHHGRRPRSESTPDHPLYHPCKCSGSIRFVHQDCLNEWLSHSRKKYCELCNHSYTFSPIYRDDMPEKVPFFVLVTQLIYRTASLLKSAFRGLTVLIVWLIILPNFTLWTWRFYFWSGENIGFNTHGMDTATPTTTNTTTTTANTTLAEQQQQDQQQEASFYIMTLKGFLGDCLEGQIITAFVIIVFVAAYLFREWVMQNLPAEQPNNNNNIVIEENLVNQVNNHNNNNGLNNDPMVGDQFAIDTLLNAMQVINPPDENNVHVGDDQEQRMRRQLHQLRVDLENDRAERNHANNQSLAWSPSLDDRVAHDDEDLLFGGVDGVGAGGSGRASSSSSAAAAANGRNEEYTEPSRYNLRSNSHRRMNQQDQHQREADQGEQEQDHRFSHHTLEFDQTQVIAEDRWPSINQFDEDEWEDDNSVPDLIDHPEDGLDQNEAIIENLRERFGGPMNDPLINAFEREMRNRQQPEPVDGLAAAAAAVDEDEPLDVGDDINGVLEAIGMRGNPWMLVQNSVLMSLMISLCLGVAVWIPYVVGRLVILIRPITFIETPIFVMRLITDPLVDFVLDLCIPFVWSHIGGAVSSLVPHSIQVSLKTVQDQVVQTLHSNISSIATGETVLSKPAAAINTSSSSTVSKASGADSLMLNMDWGLIQTKVEAYSTIALARWHRFATGQTTLDRSMCVFIGYLVLIGLGSWYLTYGSQHRSSRRNGAGRNVPSAGETIQDLIRQQGIFLKVLMFILIELVVFPTVCGFLLDMATLPLFVNASFASRYAFHWRSPYSSYFLHWFLGTGVLFYFAIFITVCREIIRPGVMWFIRDPNDPQFHPVQEMVERPLPNLLHKISQSALIYSVMLVFGVGTVTYSLAYTGVVFPLRLPFNTPLSTLAIDLLIIQFLLPPLIALIKPRDYSKKALDLWWHFACRQLRLTSFMFNQRKPDEEGRHVRRTLKSFLLMQKADIPTDEFADVAIQDDDSPVVFQRDGMMVRVPKYDSVPVDPKRRMLVPVDPVTLEAIDEEERRRGHPAAADTVDEAQSTIVVYIPPNFKRRIIIFLLYMWFSISVFACSVTVLPLLTGRLLFKLYLAPESKVNDLYSFALGIYLMTGCAILAHWANEYYNTTQNANREQMIKYAKEKASKALKFFYFAIMFGIVIPLLFGIAVDLFVFMPRRAFNADTGLVIYISQNWSFGVAYMSTIHNLIHVLPANNRIRQQLDEIIGGNGIMLADSWIITRTVIAPVILVALLAIAIPGITSWVILQMLGKRICYGSLFLNLR
ncbi:conserved hypothetical protein [Mucor ambiguus]|uniref:RING-type E3 ubiquitin transferase n=1 Tax=Mucor ambiguus TaxID=91626 RepID=A0A0C9MRE3_9FUNG|nr:conserved hypothetical protein [Mucor ambiguus]